MLNLNEIETACEAATPGPWQCGPLTGGYYVLVFQDDRLSWNNDLLSSENRETDAQLCARARTWLPELVAELRKAQAKIEHLRAQAKNDLALFYTVDDYLHDPGKGYPAGHYNPDRLAVLRSTFLEVSADEAGTGD